VKRHFKFRLYTTGDTPNSTEARFNLAAICRNHLPGQHEIEMVDVLKEPARALEDGVYMTPTLVKLAPSPVQKLFGNLSQTDTVLAALGLETLKA
jgi:circadian clock protein KaiB